MELMVSSGKLRAHLALEFLWHKITGRYHFGLLFACIYRLSCYIDS